MNSAFEIQGIPVYIEGEGAETIVMVHGWPDTWRLWDGPVAHLKDQYRCVRFTLPGFDIGGPRKKVPLEAMCEFLRELVERANGGKPVTLLLHDWGCMFGYQFYLRHPQLVKRIVGVDVGDSTTLARTLTLREKIMVFAYQAWLALAWAIGGSIGDAMTRRMARMARCPTDQKLIGSNQTYPYWLFWTGAYNGVVRRFMPKCPMLFIYATKKPFRFHAPEWLAELAAKPGNQVLPFATGHWVMCEQPQKFNEAVSDWLTASA